MATWLGNGQHYWIWQTSSGDRWGKAMRNLWVKLVFNEKKECPTISKRISDKKESSVSELGFWVPGRHRLSQPQKGIYLSLGRTLK